MKRGFVALCALVSMVLVGCDLGNTSSYSATFEYLYAPTVNLLDTTYIDEDVKNVKYNIDSVLLYTLNKENLAGPASFNAEGYDVYGVDTLINNQAGALYDKIIEDVKKVDFPAIFEEKINYFGGAVEIVYSATRTATSQVYFCDTLARFIVTPAATEE